MFNGGNKMKNERFILEKIAARLKNNNQIPIIRIHNNKMELLHQWIHHEFFELGKQSKIWIEEMLTREKYSYALQEKDGNSLIFFDKHGFTYCYQPIYFENELVGVVVFGGYLLVMPDELSVENAHEKIRHFKLPPQLSSREIKQEFSIICNFITNNLKQINPHFLRIITTLEENQAERFTLKQLSTIHFLSISHIRRLFIENTGLSFKCYYRKLKLQQANILQQTTTLSKFEILEV